MSLLRNKIQKQTFTNLLELASLGVFLWVFVFFGFFIPKEVKAAILTLGPSTGTFTVGNTFDVSVFVDTENKSVNALEVSLSFPPDKLQLVSPSTGKSVIGVWTLQPNVNNQTGKIALQGGIPGGVKVSRGLITTLTFRAKSVGTAVIKILDDSRVLLHDGKGTDDLTNANNGVYNLVLPPPAGPIVVSETHPDQSKWSANANVALSWEGESEVEGYSYMLNNEPIAMPDDVVDSKKTSVVYRNLSDSIHYFHIKSLRGGSFGGITHFAIKVDTEPPADFAVKILPGSRTSSRQPIFEFSTTDKLSGIDHYELKIVPLEVKNSQGLQPLFIESSSPFITQELGLGSYDVIVRAFDVAGNIRDVNKSLKITNTIFTFIQDDGFQIGARIFPWKWFWVTTLFLLLLLVYLARRVRNWHMNAVQLKNQNRLPEHINSQLEELRQYRQKYGKILPVVLFMLVSWVGAVTQVQAQIKEVTPPLVSVVSNNITNEEIFYAGGKTDAGSTDVILHWQNLESGETYTATVASDKKGDWFYRHTTFLGNGRYIIWAQSRVGQELSAPSPQKEISVRTTGIEFGGSRISKEALYFIFIIILILLVCGLIVYIWYHAKHGRRKHALLLQEIQNAEESLRRGFAVLKRDIQFELEIIGKSKLKGAISVEEKEREEVLLKDFAEIEERLGKEIWEIERTEMQG